MQPLDALGLLVGQEAAGAEGSAGTVAGQRSQALGGVGGPPAADGFVADAQQVSEVHLGVAQFDATQGAQAQHLKGFIGQLAGVGQLDWHDQLSVSGFCFHSLHSPSGLLSNFHAGVICASRLTKRLNFRSLCDEKLHGIRMVIRGGIMQRSERHTY